METYTEKIKRFVKAVTEQETDSDEIAFYLETFEEKAYTFSRYCMAVYKMEIRMPVVRTLYAGDIERLQESIMAMDERRRIAHEAAISACAVINRLCDRFDQPRMCPETEDRYEIADFVGRFVYEVYLNGISGRVNGVDELTSVMRDENISTIPHRDICR